MTIIICELWLASRYAVLHSSQVFSVTYLPVTYTSSLQISLQYEACNSPISLNESMADSCSSTARVMVYRVRDKIRIRKNAVSISGP